MSPAKQIWLAGCVLALVLYGAFDAANMIRLNLLFTQAQTEISFWGRTAYHPEQKAQRGVHQSLQTLLSASPNHPDYLSLQARELSWLSYWQQDQKESLRLARLAREAQLSALISRPAHPHSLAKMLEYEARVQRKEN